MEKGRNAAHGHTPANAADLFEGQRPEERTLIDACLTPFSFGLTLLIPIALMITACVLLLQSRETLVQRFTIPLQRSTLYADVPRDADRLTDARTKRSSRHAAE